MCLAIPFRVVEIGESNLAKVKLEGNVQEADLSLIDDPAVGDWVLLHAGFAIEKLEEEDAHETLALFAEMGDALSGDAQS